MTVLLSAADPRRLPRWPGVVLVALAALALVACGGNPNEDVDSNEFSRPSAAAFPAQPRDNAEETDDSASEDDAGEQMSDEADGAAADDPPPATEAVDETIHVRVFPANPIRWQAVPAIDRISHKKHNQGIWIDSPK